MLQCILDFNNTSKIKNITFTNKLINQIIKTYDFYYISSDQIQNENIYLKIKDSKYLIVDQNEILNHEIGEKCFIIGFEKTIIILQISFFFKLLSYNPDLFIYFLSNTKSIINETIPNDCQEISNNYQIISNNSIFVQEIKSFNQFLYLKNPTKTLDQFFSFIKPCISGYLIKKSYFKHKENRIENFFSNQSNFIKFESMNENEYIELRTLGIGSEFRVNLIYHIEKGQLFALKKPYIIDTEIPKLIEREIENYKNIKNPFLPKFYGITKENNYIVVEFIDGQTLKNIKSLKLNDKEKIIIIMQLILVIEYFHRNNFVYRDLKPNNIIIDENKTAVLIDFDRLIKVDNLSNENFGTLDFASIYTAPEILKEGKYSKKSDIFSLGMIIYYIINEKEANLDDPIKNESKKMEILKIFDIFKQCVNKTMEERPSIYDMIYLFYVNFSFYFVDNEFYQELILTAMFSTNDDNNWHVRIRTLENPEDNKNFFNYYISMANQNDPFAQYQLGKFYIDGKYVKQDINKAIYYYTLSANLNFQNAQLELGYIYYHGKYVQQDIPKSIFYFTLAAKQNNIDAQYSLGVIYEFSYLRDINKAIYYYTLAADQNHLNAQNNLGLIYIKGNGVKNDIDRAIHYLKLAANQNHEDACFNLGFLYENIKQNIEKMLYYYNRASDLNYDAAQFKLGLMYYLGKHGLKDINKAIHYFSLSAKNNNQYSQFLIDQFFENIDILGNDINEIIEILQYQADNNNNQRAQFALSNIYLNKTNVLDINKGIYYLKLSANQNYVKALFTLACFYLQGLYFEKDINKSIYYMTLAANQNCSEALYNLGIIYSSNEYTKSDYPKALHFLKLAAQQNDKMAQFELGNIYYIGSIVPHDIEKAIYYYTLAANQNHSGALFKLGTIYDVGRFVFRDVNKAIYYYTLASNQNNVKAQYNLGIVYFENKNIEKSIHYFTLAANQNFPNAQKMLGDCYFDGKYIKKNIEKAIFYYTQAAKQNYGPAQIQLGAIYGSGKNVPIDIDKAIYYLKLAVDNNVRYSNYNLGAVYLLKKDYKKAIHCFKIEASKNYALAQFNLGSFYANGLYVKRNIDKAIYYYTLAANQKFSHAYFALGYIYALEKHNRFDMNKAIYYYKLAAKNNNAYAQYFLGLYYYLGYYVTKNIDKCIDLLTKSSENFNKFSSFMLGSIYHFGECIEINISKAISYYKKASSFNNQYSKNNLGILYKNGFGNEVPQKLGLAIEYFEEAIRQKNDILSSYNLAHIYIYDLISDEYIDKAINILIKSLNEQEFGYSYVLLCLALIKKFGFDIEKIQKEVDKKNLSSHICRLAVELKLDNKETFEIIYNLYKSIDFLYDSLCNPFQSKNLHFIHQTNINYQNDEKLKDITNDFYSGFGI